MGKLGISMRPIKTFGPLTKSMFDSIWIKTFSHFVVHAHTRRETQKAWINNKHDICEMSMRGHQILHHRATLTYGGGKRKRVNLFKFSNFMFNSIELLIINDLILGGKHAYLRLIKSSPMSRFHIHINPCSNFSKKPLNLTLSYDDVGCGIILSFRRIFPIVFGFRLLNFQI